jgi:uncharacterized protein YcbK (DUF882 family)
LRDDACMTLRAGLSRRRFLLASGGACAASMPFARMAAANERALGGERWLELVNTHTSETLTVAFQRAGQFVATALADLARILRDHRSGVVHPIDAQLYLQLVDLASAAEVDPRFEIISGYRSPATNAKLANNSSGVARRSLHMDGRAIDVRLKGVSCARLRDLALVAARGGVGYYHKSDFVHLDTGRFRAWAG